MTKKLALVYQYLKCDQRIGTSLPVTEVPGIFSGTVYFLCALIPVLLSAPESFWRVPLSLLLLSHWSAEILNQKQKHNKCPATPLLFAGNCFFSCMVSRSLVLDPCLKFKPSQWWPHSIVHVFSKLVHSYAWSLVSVQIQSAVTPSSPWCLFKIGAWQCLVLVSVQTQPAMTPCSPWPLLKNGAQ